MSQSNGGEQSRDPADEGVYPVAAWFARLEQGCLVVVGLLLIAVGLAQALDSILTPGTSVGTSIALGVAIVSVGITLAWRMLQRRTYHLLRKGRFSLLDFIIG